ncbi:MAG: ActS/PrrB/RegB family redox-sensitive histidine kinase [Hyphomicrobiales bacterium]
MSSLTAEQTTRSAAYRNRLEPLVRHETHEGLRLQTMIRLRWLAVLGQTIAVLVVGVLLKFPLPLAWCLAVIALSAWLNIFLSVRWRSGVRLAERYSTILLGYDVLQLSALLYLTGGMANPFSFLLIVPVTVSAAALPLERTMLLGMLALGLSAMLTYWRLPLPWPFHQPIELPQLYIFGMWMAVASGISFSALYAWKTASETRAMSKALAETEMILAREQQLSALDGMAAAAAHELGTPLATIHLVASELRNGLAHPDQLDEDIELLFTQSARCREILARLSSREAGPDEMFSQQKLSIMVEEIVAPLRTGKVAIDVSSRTAKGSGPEPSIHRNPGIRYGLTNLVSNAVDFAASRVDIDVEWFQDSVAIVIADDGPGFSADVIDRLGEPFVTTRRLTDGLRQEGSAEGGMGLGFFIAKTLLERSGARVSLANKPVPDHGAVVRIDWPRTALDRLTRRET